MMIWRYNDDDDDDDDDNDDDNARGDEHEEGKYKV